ncbi:MAG TPA: hypothetical protein VN811_12915 [Thermoanaerobaculia bacterium]|nr:hypothetical protein [Thermoanaerobaculia bacterium]
MTPAEITPGSPAAPAPTADFAKSRPARWVTVALLLAMHALALANAVLHPPEIAYDAGAHLSYAVVLSEGRLPTRAETYEYFSPPLAYVLPALTLAAGWSHEASAKAAQLLNVVLSLGIALGLLRLCRVAAPAEPWLGPCALGLLAMLPVYYKSLAQPIRSEVWLALLAVLLAWRLVLVVAAKQLTARHALLLVLLGGGLLLARQFGVFVLVAAGLFLLAGVARRRELRRPALLAIAALALGAFTLAGWFYAHLFLAYGSPAAYARQSPGRGLRNQEPSFYFGTGDGQLFTLPLRPAFPNQLLPILYADTWGDYWQYFLVWGRTPHRVLAGRNLEGTLHRVPERVVTNRSAMGRYLGRVARLALLPSVVLIAGFCYGFAALARWMRRASSRDAAAALAALIVAVTAAGYFYFLVQYPARPLGTTIKATYVLHAFPFLALLGGYVLVALRQWRRTAWRLVVAALVAVGLFAAGAMVTRYPAAAGAAVAVAHR